VRAQTAGEEGTRASTNGVNGKEGARRQGRRGQSCEHERVNGEEGAHERHQGRRGHSCEHEHAKVHTNGVKGEEGARTCKFLTGFSLEQKP
jgi:hypothetical protein